MSARLDEGTLARFWASLNQPVRPAVQAWTAIPILPEKLEEFRRVETRQLEYKSITEPRTPIEEGPNGNPFLGGRRFELGGPSQKCNKSNHPSAGEDHPHRVKEGERESPQANLHPAVN